MNIFLKGCLKIIPLKLVVILEDVKLFYSTIADFNR